MVHVLRKGAFDSLADFPLCPPVDEVGDWQVADAAALVPVVDDRGDFVLRCKSKAQRKSHGEGIPRLEGYGSLAADAAHLDQRLVRRCAVMQPCVNETPVEAPIRERQGFGVLAAPSIRLGLGFMVGIEARDRHVSESEPFERFDVVASAAHDEDFILRREILQFPQDLCVEPFRLEKPHAYPSVPYGGAGA